MQVYVSHVSGFVGKAVAAALVQDEPSDLKVVGSVHPEDAVPKGVAETAFVRATCAARRRWAIALRRMATRNTRLPATQVGSAGVIDLALTSNVVILDLYGMHDESATIIAGTLRGGRAVLRNPFALACSLGHSAPFSSQHCARRQRWTVS